MNRILPIVLLATLLSSGRALSQASTVPVPKLSGYLQLRETYRDRIGLTATLNRARVSVDGSLPSRFSYRFLVEYEAPAANSTTASVSLRDAYLRWSRSPWTLTLGQYKTPFSREYITSITAIETADRAAAVDTLAPKRDLGIMGEYALRLAATAAIGVFNGEGQNAMANRDSTVLVVSRLTARPISQLLLGVNAAAYGDDSTRYGADVNLSERGFLLRGEYLAQHRHGAGRRDEGWLLLAGYRVLPRIQLVAKQDDYQGRRAGAHRRAAATTFGINADLGADRVRLVVDYVRQRMGSPSRTRDLVIGQIQGRF